MRISLLGPIDWTDTTLACYTQQVCNVPFLPYKLWLLITDILALVESWLNLYSFW